MALKSNNLKSLDAITEFNEKTVQRISCIDTITHKFLPGKVNINLQLLIGCITNDKI